MNDEQRTLNQKEKRNLFRFRKWPVYKAAKSFRKKMRKVARDLPESERYLLRDQISRAADSICLNTCPVKLLEVEYVFHLHIAEFER